MPSIREFIMSQRSIYAFAKSDIYELAKALSEDLQHKVQSGSAHWVTIKDEDSPLHGRHLLIDGPRPEKGEKSSGRILAGHGIPVHVVEKITGAKSGGDIKTEHNEDTHVVQAMSHSAKLNALGAVHQGMIRDRVKKEFAEGAHRIAVIHAGKYVYTVPIAQGESSTSDADMVNNIIKRYGIKRGSEITVVHKHGNPDADDTTVFNSSGKQLNAGAEKAKREKRENQASQLLATLAKFGVDKVQFNKESQTEKERTAITHAATSAFNILSKTSPMGAVKKTAVTLMLGKLSTGSKAWAHYTPSQRAIYMTSKQDGMKPFFHEYGHAMDHAVSGYKGYASESGILQPLIKAIRDSESHQAFINGLGKQGTKWSYWNASSGAYGKKYFQSGRETFARFFAEYTYFKAEENGVQVPDELREPNRFEGYTKDEMKNLASVFENIMKSHGLEKSLLFSSDTKEGVTKSMSGIRAFIDQAHENGIRSLLKSRTKSEWQSVKHDKADEYGTDEYFADLAHDSYPLTKDGKPSRERTMAAWRYIHTRKDGGEYSAEERERIESRIRAFAKKHFGEELQKSGIREFAKAKKAHRFAYKTSHRDPIYIPVNRIRDPYQTGKALSEEKIRENVSKMKAGEPLDPVVIGYGYRGEDGNRELDGALADCHDGHHRIEASKRMGYTHVPCVVGGADPKRVSAADKRYRSVWKSKRKKRRESTNPPPAVPQPSYEADVAATFGAGSGLTKSDTKAGKGTFTTAMS